MCIAKKRYYIREVIPIIFDENSMESNKSENDYYNNINIPFQRIGYR